MKETPLLMCGEMVQAVLGGTKTVTRRVMKHHPAYGFPKDFNELPSRREFDLTHYCPYGGIGDRIWVRETFASNVSGVVAYREGGEVGAWVDGGNGEKLWIHHGYILEAPGYPFGKETLRTFGLKKYGKWKPSIFMPRWASRITLEVTNVRVERVKDITEADAMREGCWFPDRVTGENYTETCRQTFQRLWEKLNGPRGFGWDVNPWVWVVEFKRIESGR